MIVTQGESGMHVWHQITDEQRQVGFVTWCLNLKALHGPPRTVGFWVLSICHRELDCLV